MNRRGSAKLQGKWNIKRKKMGRQVKERRKKEEKGN